MNKAALIFCAVLLLLVFEMQVSAKDNSNSVLRGEDLDDDDDVSHYRKRETGIEKRQLKNINQIIPFEEKWEKEKTNMKKLRFEKTVGYGFWLFCKNSIGLWLTMFSKYLNSTRKNNYICQSPPVLHHVHMMIKVVEPRLITTN